MDEPAITDRLLQTTTEIRLEGLAYTVEEAIKIGIIPQIDGTEVCFEVSVNDYETASRYEGTMKDRLYSIFFRTQYPELFEGWVSTAAISGISLLQFMQDHSISHGVVTYFPAICEALSILVGYIIIDIKRPSGKTRINAIQTGVGNFLHEILSTNQYYISSSQVFEKERMLSFLIIPKNSE